jgi:serine/threonine protein kinase
MPKLCSNRPASNFNEATVLPDWTTLICRFQTFSPKARDYLVMDFVPGGSRTPERSAKSIFRSESAGLAAQLADALSYLRARFHPASR